MGEKCARSTGNIAKIKILYIKIENVKGCGWYGVFLGQPNRNCL